MYPLLMKWEAEQFMLKRILVPLDGTKEHETGLSSAIDVAFHCQAELYLMLVIPTQQTLSAKNSPGRIFMPSTINEVLNFFKTDTDKYLSDRIKQIEKNNINVSGEVARGDPAIVISNIAGKNDFDLVVVGTHGKAGLSALWAGSIAAKITGKTRSAILFIPII